MTERLGREGVAVLRVAPGSAAAIAGLQPVRVRADGTITPGDVILAINGRSVDSVARLLSRLDDYTVGDTVRLTVLRGNSEREVTVKLQAGSQ